MDDNYLSTFVVLTHFCYQNQNDWSYILKDAEFQGRSENKKIILGWNVCRIGTEIILENRYINP